MLPHEVALSQPNHPMSAPRLTPFVSIPALAAAIRQAARDEVTVPALSHGGRSGLVPMYTISPVSPEPGAEAVAAAQVLVTVADRMQRLVAAYGEWTEFDAEAYFDLTAEQATYLLHLTERVTSVHLSFFMDALLPSFQRAARYWARCYLPHHVRMQHLLAQSGDAHEDAPQAAQQFADEVQPTMIAHWQRLLTVARHTRRLLNDDPAFWALNAANDERLRQRGAWRAPPAPGMATALLPRLTDVPTLTLSIDFPLPAYRQPGRLRRLRRGRAWQARHAQSGRAQSGHAPPSSWREP